MFLTSDAIVISRTRHSDTTLILRLLTQEKGAVTFTLRIPKTSRAQLRPQLFQPLAQLQIEWDHQDNREFQRLRNAQAIPYLTLPYDQEKAPTLSLVSEILSHALKNEHQGDTVEMLQQSLRWLDKTNKGYQNFPIILLLQLTRHLGIEPNQENPHLPIYDLTQAEYTASIPPHKYYLEPHDARHIPLFLRLNYQTMHLLKLTPAQQHRALRIIWTYYQLHIPSLPRLRSLEIIENI